MEVHAANELELVSVLSAADRASLERLLRTLVLSVDPA
jgi:hypothetical protein